MNKQELISRLIKLLEAPSEIEGSDFDNGHNYGIERAIILAEQLNEQQAQINKPEKPVVPRFVADFYESIKDDFEDGVYELCVQFNLDASELNSDVAGWFDQPKNKPIETLVMMHKFGYEVEKEKLYTVELPSPNCQIDDHYILSRLKNGKIIINRYCIEQWEKFGDCQLTESEIKEDFEWAWQFAKVVEE